jgi:hypothetical protein
MPFGRRAERASVFRDAPVFTFVAAKSKGKTDCRSIAGNSGLNPPGSGTEDAPVADDKRGIGEKSVRRLLHSCVTFMTSVQTLKNVIRADRRADKRPSFFRPIRQSRFLQGANAARRQDETQTGGACSSSAGG